MRSPLSDHAPEEMAHKELRTTTRGGAESWLEIIARVLGVATISILAWVFIDHMFGEGRRGPLASILPVILQLGAIGGGVAGLMWFLAEKVRLQRHSMGLTVSGSIGRRFVDELACSHCGTRLLGRERVCPGCGLRLEDDETADLDPAESEPVGLERIEVRD